MRPITPGFMLKPVQSPLPDICLDIFPPEHDMMDVHFLKGYVVKRRSCQWGREGGTTYQAQVFVRPPSEWPQGNVDDSTSSGWVWA